MNILQFQAPFYKELIKIYFSIFDPGEHNSLKMRGINDIFYDI